jgi:peptidoglycan hydrolase-like protein with peptidoglycan-binding domain
MGATGEIRSSNVRGPGSSGSNDAQICRVRESLVDLNSLHIQGDFSPRDIQRVQGELRNTAGADTSATREQIAEQADATTSQAPEAYTTNGRYTEAATDADARLGFRGDRVRAVQQRLVDEGHLTGENAVDGFWGPQTQAAYERSQAGQRADQTTQNLTRDIRSGNTDAINQTLSTASNRELREIDRRLPRNNDGTYSTPLPNVNGDDSDYADFSNMMLRGDRNEGTAARADARVIDRFQDQILRARVSPFSREMGATHNIGSAWNGTDEDAINRVFSQASSAQLQALDQRIRRGVRDENGEMVRFNDGLAGLVRSEIGAGAHRDALLAQLNRE